GIGIDMWMYFIGDWMIPSTWIGQSVYLTMGIVFTAMGVATYLQSNFAPNPFDRSMLVISKKTACSIASSRAFVSVALVRIAYLLDGAIDIGTRINALLSGVIIKLFIRYVTVIKANTE